MAFSGDKTWGVTRDDIVKAALRKIGSYDAANTPATDEISDAAVALNALVKEWTGQGLGLWLRQRTLLILNPGFQRYSLGPSGTTGTTDNFHAFADTLLKANTIASDEAAAETVLSIEDDDWVDFQGQTITKPTTGNIGIRLDDGSIHWTTIAGVGTDTVTLTAALPSAASSGRQVYAYATRTSRPVRVVAAYREDTSGNASEVRLLGRTEYEQLSRKGASGEPLCIHFDPQLTDAKLHVWPASNSLSTDKLVLVTEHYSDDLDSASNNPQFPAEWANALIWNLAAELAFEYGKPADLRVQLLQIAGQKKTILFETADVENAAVTFAPERG